MWNKLMEFIILLLCFFCFFFLFWLIIGYGQHKQDVLFEEFYKKHSVKTHAKILHFSDTFWRGGRKCAYNIVIRIQGQSGRSFEYNISTNNPAAKQYASIEEIEISCLPDVITKKCNIVDFVKGKCSDNADFYQKMDLCTIPLAVIPEDETFIRNGRAGRCKTLLCVFLVFCFVSIFYLICEQFPMPAVTNLITKFVPLIAVSLPIFTLLVSRRRR